MSVYALNMITMIGMAVGIDYASSSSIATARNRRRGLSKLDAIEAAGDTASRAVLFSGGTVAIALVGMFLLPTTLFRSLGAGAILVVAVAVLATLTLVPAVLESARRPHRLAAPPDEPDGQLEATQSVVRLLERVSPRS